MGQDNNNSFKTPKGTGLKLEASNNSNAKTMILVKGVTPNASKIEQQFDPVKDQAAMNAFIQTLRGLGCTILTQPMRDYAQRLKNELEALYGENSASPGSIHSDRGGVWH